MSGSQTAFRPHKRKATDEEITLYNSLGLSFRFMGELLGVHHTTIQKRLQLLGVPIADTRRSFMDTVFSRLSTNEIQWLLDQLDLEFSAQDFFVQKIKEGYFAHRASQQTQNP